ncbi:unnamed protein product, partial [Pylaiella littoralis]
AKRAVVSRVNVESIPASSVIALLQTEKASRLYRQKISNLTKDPSEGDRAAHTENARPCLSARVEPRLGWGTGTHDQQSAPNRRSSRLLLTTLNQTN